MCDNVTQSLVIVSTQLEKIKDFIFTILGIKETKRKKIIKDNFSEVIVYNGCLMEILFWVFVPFLM